MIILSPDAEIDYILIIGIGFLVFVFVVLIVASIVKSSRPTVKTSEELIANHLENNFGEESKIINDVIIEDDHKNKTQIDHIVFSASGIHVIETKGHSGEIYGDENQQQWLQVLGDGSVRNELYNPLMQNNMHIACLSRLLKTNVPIYSYVVFTNGNIDHVDAKDIYTPSTLREALLLPPERSIAPYEIERCYKLVLKFKENPICTMEEYVSEIENVQNSIKSGFCPRCGKPLVLHHDKEGKPFYGCADYPKCSFKKRQD